MIIRMYCGFFSGVFWGRFEMALRDKQRISARSAPAGIFCVSKLPAAARQGFFRYLFTFCFRQFNRSCIVYYGNVLQCQSFKSVPSYALRRLLTERDGRDKKNDAALYHRRGKTSLLEFVTILIAIDGASAGIRDVGKWIQPQCLYLRSSFKIQFKIIYCGPFKALTFKCNCFQNSSGFCG